jgi:hypothetical protein
VLAAQLTPASDASSPRSPRSPRSMPLAALVAAAPPPLLELGVRGLKAGLSQRMCDTKASLTLGEIVLAAHPPAGRVPLLVGRGEGGEGGEGADAALLVLHTMLVRPGSPEYAAAAAEAAFTGAVQAVRLYLVPAALQAVGGVVLRLAARLEPLLVEAPEPPPELIIPAEVLAAAALEKRARPSATTVSHFSSNAPSNLAASTGRSLPEVSVDFSAIA